MLAAAPMVLGGACSPSGYLKSADRQVYAILNQKHDAIYNRRVDYEIRRLAQSPLAGLDRTSPPLVASPQETTAAEEFRIVDLTQAIEIAAHHNSEFQGRKEDVYLTALALTETRHRFSSQFSGLAGLFYGKSAGDETLVATGEMGLVRLLESGARIGLNLSTEFLRHLTGSPHRTAASILAVSILQPLWRGAGERFAAENLLQAERDVIYGIRSFARYRKIFEVRIRSAYYRILEQRAVVRNEHANYRNLTLAGRRAAMLAQAGRLPEFQADQARQDRLRARDRWSTAVQRYYEMLDAFKIDLGIPVDVSLELDENDLQQLLEKGLKRGQPAVSMETAVATAMRQRQDLKNFQDRVADARRKIAVARNNLGPDLDLVLDVSLPTRDDTHWGDFRTGQAIWNAGLDLSLPLDRLAERNAYRQAFIHLERAKRDLNLQTDQVKLEVRSAWRSLRQAEESYQIQKNSLALARRRVDSTNMLLQAGRTDTRDVLDAQAALVEAQNGVIRVLTDHLAAQLALDRDMGILSPYGDAT